MLLAALSSRTAEQAPLVQIHFFLGEEILFLIACGVRIGECNSPKTRAADNSDVH
jgi:hypothetical protein